LMIMVYLRQKQKNYKENEELFTSFFSLTVQFLEFQNFAKVVK